MGLEELARRLTDRLAHSGGGSFLLTGMRGTGKTTVLHRAIADWRHESSDEVIVAVHLVLARPMDEETLLFEIIRRLFEELTTEGLLSDLEEDLREWLLVAYARTSYSQKQSHSATREHQAGMSVGGLWAWAKACRSPSQRARSVAKIAETTATELSFLAYSRSDAEHDFLRILRLLSEPRPRATGRLKRCWYWVRGKDLPTLRLRVIIALDEVDKLTSADAGQEAFDKLLSAMKNAFSVSNVHVVIVAGIDQHDRWLAEGRTTDSLYRSIFAWHGYQRCLWDTAGALVEASIAEGQDAEAVRIIADYVEFRGRGIVRALLAEFNELVEWRDGRPVIALDGIVEQRVNLVADLQAAMRGPLAAAGGGSVLASPAVEDLWRSRPATPWTGRSGPAASDSQSAMYSPVCAMRPTTKKGCDG